MPSRRRVSFIPLLRVCPFLCWGVDFIHTWSVEDSITEETKSRVGERPVAKGKDTMLAISCNGSVPFPFHPVITGVVTGRGFPVFLIFPVCHGNTVGAHPFIHEGPNVLLKLRGGDIRAIPVASRWWVGSDWWQGDRWGNLGPVGGPPSCRENNGEIGCGYFQVAGDAAFTNHSCNILFQTAPPDPGRRPR